MPHERIGRMELLTVESGAPIRLNSELFSAATAAATAAHEGEDSPSCLLTTADIAAEARNRKRDPARPSGTRSSGSGSQDIDPGRPPTSWGAQPVGLVKGVRRRG
jgi:hypothetical protein